MPVDWKSTTLGTEAELLSGFPFRSSEYTDNPRDVRLLRGDNIAQGNIRWANAKRWSLEDAPNFEQYELKKDDVVLAMDRPWIDAGLKYAAIDDDDLPCLLLQRTTRLRGGPNLDIRFLRYVIGSPEFTKHIQSITTGSLVPHISSRQIKDFVFRLPPLATQERIAAVLSALDAKIALNHRINSELEGMAKLLYDYWFVQYDFPLSAAQAAALGKPHLTGQPYRSSGGPMVYNPQLKREIPKGWVPKELSDIADITMGQSPPGHTYNNDWNGVLFFQGSTDFGWRYPSPRQYTTAPTRMAKMGDILLSVRAPVGTLNIAPEECAIGRGLSALRSKSGSSSFLFQVLQNLQQVFARRNGDGTTFGSINRDDLRSLHLAYPSEEEIVRSFDRIVSETDSLIFTNHQQNQELTTLRDWLLPMLMNGQVRVG
jgi:type I restriction enzyme, S subunit